MLNRKEVELKNITELAATIIKTKLIIKIKQKKIAAAATSLSQIFTIHVKKKILLKVKYSIVVVKR